jgi:hypothetical protein
VGFIGTYSIEEVGFIGNYSIEEVGFIGTYSIGVGFIEGLPGCAGFVRQLEVL